MSSSTTLIGDRRRAVRQRTLAANRHPAARRTRRTSAPPPLVFYVMLGIVAMFVVLGLVMVMSASSMSEYRNGHSPWRVFERQARWAVLGVISAWAVSRAPLHVLRRWSPLLLVASVGAMALPFVPGLGTTINGARAWIQLGPFSVQPSEFLKLAVLVHCASVLTKRHERMHDVRATLVPVLLVGGFGAALCLAQSDLGSAIVLVSVVFVMAFLAGAPLMPMGVAGVGSALVALGFVYSTPYRRARFTAFLDITANKDYLSYQTWQAMIATANGGWTGQGIGRGVSKLGDFLPYAHSDFIFAVIAEELGFVGVFSVLGGFVVLAFCGMQVALATPDRFGKLIAGGVVGWLVVQTLINVGGVTGAMPVTGLTLPFFSAGGSSLFVTLTAIGLMFNVARRAR